MLRILGADRLSMEKILMYISDQCSELFGVEFMSETTEEAFARVAEKLDF
jgi:hypothetical protein